VLAVARAACQAGSEEHLFSLGISLSCGIPPIANGSTSAASAPPSNISRPCAVSLLKRPACPLTPTPGRLSREELLGREPVNASLGMMLETTSRRLLSPGEAHYRCPDKVPEIGLRPSAGRRAAHFGSAPVF
jgi:FO synthase